MKLAKWIWIKNKYNENTWLNFVKDIRLEESNSNSKVVARIAVDTKYWLYVNGEMAVFEGGLKRGPSPSSTYYDEVDITSYMREGNNRIGILVWYYGKNGFSHKSSGQGGLLCEIQTDKAVYVSDSTWKTIKNPAYIDGKEEIMLPNFRLVESNLHFDGALDIGDWFTPEYDVSMWKAADVLGKVGDKPWGTLVKRMIPKLKDYGLCSYINSDKVEDLYLEEDSIIEMKLPHNAQITPYLEISAPAKAKIIIKTDNYDTIVPEEKCLMNIYYTKEGKQKYEGFSWMNGESVYYYFPAGTKIHALKYRETGYDTKMIGQFSCDDEFLNKLWNKSLRTLYVTMRDTFMDCPDRERAQWWGDVNIEMQMMMYGMDSNALLLYKSGVNAMASWENECGNMVTVVPSGSTLFELPFQNLAGIHGFYYYYEYTKDLDVVQIAYPMAKRYLLSYQTRENGLVEHKEGSWDWVDWGENADMEPMENAWYYMALKSCYSMALLLGFTEDTHIYKERMVKIEKSFMVFVSEKGYVYHSTNNKKPDDRANALAVLSGLLSEKYYESIRSILTSTYNASPYMEKYVLDAMCEMGYIEEAIMRMKFRYEGMVEDSYSTLWEYWNTDGTRNHAWSGGPLITMAKYIAGIKPKKPGYDEFTITPNLGNLQWVDCRVPTGKGMIHVHINKDGKDTNIELVSIGDKV